MDQESQPAQQESHIPVPAHALERAVKIMKFSHQSGVFSKFTVKEAMEHLSLIIYLESLLKDGN
jgi:hypothetical protein